MRAGFGNKHQILLFLSLSLLPKVRRHYSLLFDIQAAIKHPVLRTFTLKVVFLMEQLSAKQSTGELVNFLNDKEKRSDVLKSMQYGSMNTSFKTEFQKRFFAKCDWPRKSLQKVHFYVRNHLTMEEVALISKTQS